MLSLLAPPLAALAGAELVPSRPFQRLEDPRAYARVFVDGQPAPDGWIPDVRAWSGSLTDAPGGEAFLAVSALGVHGWLRATGEGTLVASGAGAAERWAAAPFACATRGPSAAGPPALEALAAPVGAPFATLFRARVAVETDWQFTELFGDPRAAAAYTLSLLAAVRQLYREEVGVLLEFPYVGFYTSPDDPWAAPDSDSFCNVTLMEFAAAWGNGGAPVRADLHHRMSGSLIGCGMAMGLDLACDPRFSFSVGSGMTGTTTFPPEPGPLIWDFRVTAHELAHLLGSPHTHEFCPPLDECSPFDGPCQSGQACIPDGTLMSYCQLCPGGFDNTQPHFHPGVVQHLRESLRRSCLGR